MSAKAHIVKGDTVMIRRGKEKGKRGVVKLVMPDSGQAIVEGMNIVKRHTKPNPQANQPGGIVEREASIHASNVMLVNGTTGKGERVGFKTLDDGRKVRVFRRSGEQADA